VRADKLVRVGIVRHDVIAGRNGHRVHRVWRKSDSARQLHCTVFVCVLEADVQNRRLVAAIQAFFQLFFRDSFNGYCFPWVGLRQAWRALRGMEAADFTRREG